MSTCQIQLLSAASRQYEATFKHGRGGFGTPMDLDATTATAVLRAALYDPAEAARSVPSLWGYHSGNVYRFMCDGAVPAKWHGYPADEKPPNSVMQEWRRLNVISEAEYNRLRRRPNRGR